MRCLLAWTVRPSLRSSATLRECPATAEQHDARGAAEKAGFVGGERVRNLIHFLRGFPTRPCTEPGRPRCSVQAVPWTGQGDSRRSKATFRISAGATRKRQRSLPSLKRRQVTCPPALPNKTVSLWIAGGESIRPPRCVSMAPCQSLRTRHGRFPRPRSPTERVRWPRPVKSTGYNAKARGCLANATSRSFHGRPAAIAHISPTRLVPVSAERSFIGSATDTAPARKMGKKCVSSALRSRDPRAFFVLTKRLQRLHPRWFSIRILSGSQLVGALPAAQAAPSTVKTGPVVA